MADQNPTPRQTVIDWRHVLTAVVAAAITALLHQLGVIPVTGAKAPEKAAVQPVATALVRAASCDCVKCPCRPCKGGCGPRLETAPMPREVGANSLDVINYGVDVWRLDTERRSYGPGYVPKNR